MSAPVFCGQCGRPLAEGGHEGCARRLVLEPPRFCAACARRMKVQVDPLGWTAECVEHGVTTG
ncbi:MAG: hypothetical protein U0R80_10435 [Nocardioidaceae bacterium]